MPVNADKLLIIYVFRHRLSANVPNGLSMYIGDVLGKFSEGRRWRARFRT